MGQAAAVAELVDGNVQERLAKPRALATPTSSLLTVMLAAAGSLVMLTSHPDLLHSVTASLTLYELLPPVAS